MKKLIYIKFIYKFKNLITFYIKLLKIDYIFF